MIKVRGREEDNQNHSDYDGKGRWPYNICSLLFYTLIKLSTFIDVFIFQNCIYLETSLFT